jgi:predicted nucleic acid-binding Zn ribbon protein
VPAEDWTDPGPAGDSVDDPAELPADLEPAVPSGIDAAKQALARARAAAAQSPAAPRAAGRGSTGRHRRRPSDGGTRSRDPQSLGSTVDRLLRDRGWDQPAAVGGLTGRWSDIVGPDVAEHVVPETFEQAPDGRGLLLVLRADSTAWATTIQYMLPAVRTRIDAELGPGTVRDITVLGPAAPSWKHGRLRVPGRGPRDTYG